jgi:hypothetical protein
MINVVLLPSDVNTVHPYATPIVQFASTGQQHAQCQKASETSEYEELIILSCVWVTCKTGFGLVIGFIDHSL